MRSLLLLTATITLICGTHADGQSGLTQYQDTPTDLKQLLTDSIQAARVHDNDRLSRVLDRMRIPEYKQWFADCEYQSESWAEAYGKQVSSPLFGNSLKSRLLELSDRNGAVEALRLNDGPNAPGGLDDGLIHSLKKPVNIYRAGWMDQDAAVGHRPELIGYFVYADGAFRWYSIIRKTNVNVPRGWMPRRTRTPKFPYPNDGQHASGVVHLKFVIRDDGSVDHVKPVLAIDSTKDKALIESAIDAVRQWNLVRMQPTESASSNVDDCRIRVAPEEVY